MSVVTATLGDGSGGGSVGGLGVQRPGFLGFADQLVWLEWQSPGSVKKDLSQKNSVD